MNKLFPATISLITILTSGCVQRHYDGDPLENDHIARIDARGATILAINGRPVEDDSRTVEVLPGRQVVDATVVTNSPLKSTRKVGFFAEAGKAYYVSGSSGSPNCIEIRDEAGNLAAKDKKGCDVKMVSARSTHVEASVTEQPAPTE